MLVASNITVQFDQKPLFENINAKFGGGNRYGLIGANGAGKTTLMKVFSNLLKPQNGSISVSGGNRIGVLEQDQFAYEKVRVIDTVIMGNKELWKIHEERHKLYSLPKMTEKEGMRVADLEMQYMELDGYSAESRAGELLLGLDIDESYHSGPMGEMPPALKLRVLLAQVLFPNPDLFLLDEPTNNLDINTIRWLENMLNKSSATMIIISHDRHFLNAVCTHIADLDYGSLKIYPGNYDAFTIASLEAKTQLTKDRDKKQAQIEELKSFVRRFSANASKAKQATSRAKQITKIKLEDIRVSSRKSPYIVLDVAKRIHKNVLEVANLTKSFGELKLFKDVKFSIKAGDKVAVIGQTGIGKTTMMQCILKELPVDDGTSATIKISENANIGYIPQNYSEIFKTFKSRSLAEFLYDYKKLEDDEQSIRNVLGRMLFSGEAGKKLLSSLSGGEKVRILLAKLMLEKPNVLFLDEPTNHLDMESIQALNLALEKYEGTILFISHDRELVSSVANKIIEITKDDVCFYHGNYEDYLSKQLADKK